jgi:hypothetical protein
MCSSGQYNGQLHCFHFELAGFYILFTTWWPLFNSLPHIIHRYITFPHCLQPPGDTRLLPFAHDCSAFFTIFTLTLPVAVLAFAGIQTLWWLAAAITLIVRTEKTSDIASVKVQEPAGSAQ